MKKVEITGTPRNPFYCPVCKIDYLDPCLNHINQVVEYYRNRKVCFLCGKEIKEDESTHYQESTNLYSHTRCLRQRG